MTELDCVRWGDSFTFPLPVGSGGIFRSEHSGQHQLAQCHWRWPITWQVATISSLQPGAGENVDFAVIYQFTIGVGGSQATLFRPVRITFASNYDPVNDLFQLPAQDIQVTAVFTSITPPIGTTVGSLLASCFIAPVTEPHAMTEMLRVMKGEERGQRFIESGPTHGFHPEPLHYQR